MTAAPGVPETFEAFGREVPDVLLSNIEMPGEDGYALIRKVRALPPDRGGRIPAVALTGLSTAADRARALRAGFGHVAKPVDAWQLVTIVTTLAASIRQGLPADAIRRPVAFGHSPVGGPEDEDKFRGAAPGNLLMPSSPHGLRRGAEG